MTEPLEAVTRSIVDGPLLGHVAPPLSPVSGAMQAGPWLSTQTAARNKIYLSV